VRLAYLNLKKIPLLLYAIAFLLTLFISYNLAYFNKTLPNTYIGSQSVSGKTKEQLEDLLTARIESLEKGSVIFEFEDNKLETDLKSLGVNFVKGASLQQAWSQRKSVNFLEKTQITPIYHIDFPELNNFLDTKLSLYETKAKNASINFEGGKIQISQESQGKVIDRSALLFKLREKIENLTMSPIILKLIDDQPQINASQAQSALNKVETLNNQQIVLTYELDSWKLSGQNLLSILKFYPYGQKQGYTEKFTFYDEPTIVNSVKLVDSPQPKLNVNLDNDKLDGFISTIANSIDQPTTNATLKFASGKVIEFTPARNGLKLDRRETKNLISQKVSIDNFSEGKDINITLPVTIQVAKIANEDINNLGIKELIGRGVSYFAGSIANRVYNLSLGSQRISGTLVKPGETFSFNQSVGEVTASTGYKQAYVISKGRTVLDDGGGMCQVSTTVFRAALNAGLPIVSRTAHAYRVGYYEQKGFKAGLDATVWAPSVDLKFKNDTDKHILVQAVVDRTTSKLEIDIYGTNDARRVEISDPVISNQKPPPEDKYEEDPTLAKGTVKQVDFAASGATSVFTRKVFKANELIIDDTFKSVYRPWQAVYLVGTGG